MFPLPSTPELLFNRTTTPLSSSFTYFSNAKSASRLQRCNAESLLSETECWEGKCGSEPHWLLLLPMAAPRLQEVNEGCPKTGWAMKGDCKRFSISVWFGLLPYSTRTASISKAYLLKNLFFQLNCIKEKKIFLCKSKGPYAYKCVSRFKNGLSVISLDWFWWAFSYTTLCRECNSHKQEGRPVRMSLSDIILNVMNQLQAKLYLMTSNSFWNKATDSKSPLRQNNSWPLSENKFLILGENIQPYIRQFSLIRILEVL